jgi:hypothetical protein
MLCLFVAFPPTHLFWKSRSHLWNPNINFWLPWPLLSPLSQLNNGNTHASCVFCLALIKSNLNWWHSWRKTWSPVNVSRKCYYSSSHRKHTDKLRALVCMIFSREMYVHPYLKLHSPLLMASHCQKFTSARHNKLITLFPDGNSMSSVSRVRSTF